jgi:transposase InsO family protein
MADPLSLVIPPLPIPQLSYSVVPPDPSTDEARALLDPFTRILWERHTHAMAGCSSKTLYGLKSLMPDSYYMHVVKELHQQGHLERHGLHNKDSLMYASIKNKLDRNVRFFLFDVEPLGNEGVLGGGVPSVPALYVVKREYVALELPSPSECKRVIPISQVRALLERLHYTNNCRVVGIEKRVADEYACVTREAQRFFKRFCLTCKEHEPQNRRLQIFRPIVSKQARDRYVIDLIHMVPCEARPRVTFLYILTMVDHFSRFRWTAPLQDKCAATVIEQLQQWWVANGKPSILQSDNGMEFAAEEMKAMCRRWGVRKRHSRPYKPSTNGAVERANRDIEERLSVWVAARPGRHWVDGLHQVTAAHNFNWTRCHRDEPANVFHAAKLRLEQTVEADETMPPVQDWSDDETDTEADREWVEPDSNDDQPTGEEADFEEKEEGDEDEDLLLTGSNQTPAGRILDPRVKVERDNAELSELPAERPLHEQPSKEKQSAPADPSATEMSTTKDPDAESVASLPHPLGDPHHNIPDEKSPLEEVLDVVAAGEVDTLRYPQWKRIDSDLWTRMGRAGVPGMGDCGVIAPLAAHRSYYLRGQSPKLSDEVIMAERNIMVKFLDEHAARVEGEERLAVDVAELRGTIAPLRSHVAVEYLWLYAMRHHLNIYLFELAVVEQVAARETRATFSVRLLTAERGDLNKRPIASEMPNTIAIYLHNVRRYEPKASQARDEEKKRKKMKGEGVPKVNGGCGHFEYLVDSMSRTSCWRTDDDAVTKVLQPALETSYRIHYINSYTRKWDESHNRRTADRLPKIAVGDIAMLMISDKVREESEYDSKLDGVGLRNMVVKVFAINRSRSPVTFEVLSHAGVVCTRLLQHEFRALGQDVDPELRAREVTEQMKAESERVGAMQAWNFFLCRRRSRHLAVVERQLQLAQNARALEQSQALSLTQSGLSGELSSSLPSPLSPSSSAADATPMPVESVTSQGATTLVPICCSCQHAIHLSRGRSPAACMGICQQPMHNVGMCTASDRWVKVGDAGLCCSPECAVLFSFV